MNVFSLRCHENVRRTPRAPPFNSFECLPQAHSASVKVPSSSVENLMKGIAKLYRLVARIVPSPSTSCRLSWSTTSRMLRSVSICRPECSGHSYALTPPSFRPYSVEYLAIEGIADGLPHVRKEWLCRGEDGFRGWDRSHRSGQPTARRGGVADGYPRTNRGRKEVRRFANCCISPSPIS